MSIQLRDYVKDVDEFLSEMLVDTAGENRHFLLGLSEKHGVPYDKLSETDPCILPLVIMFNEMGYETKYCCQGHKNGDKAYIMFEDNLLLRDFKTLIGDLFDTADTPMHHWKFGSWLRKFSGEMRYNVSFEVISRNNLYRTNVICSITEQLYSIVFNKNEIMEYACQLNNSTRERLRL